MVSGGKVTGQTLAGLLGNHFQQSCDFKYHVEDLFASFSFKAKLPHLWMMCAHIWWLFPQLGFQMSRGRGSNGCPVTALPAGSFTFWAKLLIVPKICVYIVWWNQMEGQFYFTSLSTLNFFAHKGMSWHHFVFLIPEKYKRCWMKTHHNHTYLFAALPTPARFLQKNYQLTEKNLAPVSFAAV